MLVQIDNFLPQPIMVDGENWHLKSCSLKVHIPIRLSLHYHHIANLEIDFFQLKYADRVL